MVGMMKNLLIKKIRKIFCKHEYVCIGEHKEYQMNLWMCKKCNTFYYQHYGIGIGFEVDKPDFKEWNIR